MSERGKILLEFDAASATLHPGVNVVEASAGTGKTWAIAMLVLRFVVERGVLVEELLVVSYTRAATQELRSRIRSRLLEARAILLGEDKGEGESEAVLSYLAHLPRRDEALERLELALLEMDRAAVFTIHGFCQRMLKEHALESGQLFDMELVADISKIRAELVADFWREQMYALDPLHCSLFLDHFSSPDALYQTVRGVSALDRIEPNMGISVQDSLAEVDVALERVLLWWQVHSKTLAGRIRDAIEKGMFKKDLCVAFSSWWPDCERFFSGAEQRFPRHLEWLARDGLMGELNGSKLRGVAKKKDFLADFPLADAEIAPLLAASAQAILAMRLQLARQLQTGLRERLLAQGCFSFDDLARALAQALDGPGGDGLQEALASRFKVALIDEFQDTDAAQYRIFSGLFGGREKSHFLYLIGDPKQAIYAFRGADIAAYFQARESADYFLGLGKNYRSNPSLVAAVNDLFSWRQGQDAFVSPELQYHSVAAAQDDDCWQLWQAGRPQTAMVYCSLDAPDSSASRSWTSGKIRVRLESYVVSEIQGILRDGFLVTEGGEKRAVNAGDIAILVHSHLQAESFQEALSLVRLPSVIYSKKSVYKTPECADLLLVAEAVAAPVDTRCLRAAMSCKWFGMGGKELYAAFQDEGVMESWIERFLEYRVLWQEKGILAMMNHLLVQESVFQTLCGLVRAERQISNIQHLLELLQEQEGRANCSFLHTLQYLAQEMESGAEHEGAELRLESDAQAIKVVTMHAVKGLQYPIVFCPYLWERRGFAQRDNNTISYHDQGHQRVSDLGSALFEERREAALREELAEEARLLYVAITRARCRCYVFWADVRGGRSSLSSRYSALAWVLSLEDCQDIQQQQERIAAFCAGGAGELQVLTGDNEGGGLQSNERPQGPKLCGRTFSRVALSGEWLLTSYSALAGAGLGSGAGARVLGEVERGQELGDDMATIHTLPLGAGLGNVVHGLLEDFTFAKLAGEQGYEDECQAQCRRFGVSAESEPLMALLRDLTRSPLQGGSGTSSFALMDLKEQDLMKEMPFYFHLREGSTGKINEILSFSDVVHPIKERRLKGYLTGFIDLVCRHRGRYYIMDYKTNYLGDHFGAYDAAMLVPAMHAHNYGLQYWIYTLVLHRFLEATVSGYEYGEDFGGVFYLFARGMGIERPGNGVFFERPQLSVLDALSLCLGAP